VSLRTTNDIWIQTFWCSKSKSEKKETAAPAAKPKSPASAATPKITVCTSVPERLRIASHIQPTAEYTQRLEYNIPFQPSIFTTFRLNFTNFYSQQRDLISQPVKFNRFQESLRLSSALISQ
jgi:hypothetical protein